MFVVVAAAVAAAAVVVVAVAVGGVVAPLQHGFGLLRKAVASARSLLGLQALGLVHLVVHHSLGPHLEDDEDDENDGDDDNDDDADDQDRGGGGLGVVDLGAGGRLGVLLHDVWLLVDVVLGVVVFVAPPPRPPSPPSRHLWQGVVGGVDWVLGRAVNKHSRRVIVSGEECIKAPCFTGI